MFLVHAMLALQGSIVGPCNVKQCNVVLCNVLSCNLMQYLAYCM